MMRKFHARKSVVRNRTKPHKTVRLINNAKHHARKSVVRNRTKPLS